VLGLAVGDAAGLDVEHVDLAVDAEVLAVGSIITEVLKAFSPPSSLMLPASRWTPSSRVQARAAARLGPSSGSAPRDVLAAAEQVPLLRQGDQLGAVGGGGPHEPLGDREIPGLVPGRVELHRRYAQSFVSSISVSAPPVA
jgi:hypothetical protein